MAPGRPNAIGVDFRDRLLSRYRHGKDRLIMRREPTPDGHRTGLQRRLAAEVRAGMDRHGCSQADLSRITGIGEPHISLLLRGLRQGTISSWDRLLNASHARIDKAVRVPKKVAPLPDAESITQKILEDADLKVTATRYMPPMNPLNPRRPT